MPVTAEKYNPKPLHPEQPDLRLAIAERRSASTPRPLSDYPYPNWFHWRKTESLRLVTQIALTFIVLTLCIGKLATNDDDKDKALYWGGITSLVAWWMPSPGSSTNATSEPKKQS